jgi:hypothetical protein
MACSAAAGIVPVYVDYYLVLTAGKDAQPPLLLARRDYHATPFTPPGDTFSADVRWLVSSFLPRRERGLKSGLHAQLPYKNYTVGAKYAISLETTYAVNDTRGGVYYQRGIARPLPVNITMS